MPFDAGGTFTRNFNWQADRDAGIKILAARMDGEFNNYAGGMNQTFLRTGIVPMGGPLNMNSNPIVGVAGGSLITPGIRFESDTDTGIMQSGPGNITLVADGVAVLSATAAGVTIAGTAGVKFPDGSVATPGIAFSADPDTGIYRNGAAVAVAIDGVREFHVTTGSSTFNGRIYPSTDNNFYITQPAAGNPAINWDANDFFDYQRATNLFRWVIGGVNKFQISTNEVTSINNVNAPGFVVDPNFLMALTSGRPWINFDSNDFLIYDRTTNELGLTIGGSQALSVTAARAFHPYTFMVGDANAYFSFNAGTPILAMDSNDYLGYDRAANSFRFVIGGAITGVINTTNISHGGIIQVNNSGSGGVSMTGSGVTTNTGYLAFWDAGNATRKGYIGHMPTAAGGTINYVNEGGNGGHTFTGGDIKSLDGNIYANGALYPKTGDTTAYFALSGATPYLSFDANDYIEYVRAANTMNFAIASSVRVAIGPSLTNFYGNVTVNSGTLRSVGPDGQPLLGSSGASKGFRVIHDANRTMLEGVDSTLTGSYQPLHISGTSVTIQPSAGTATIFNTNGHVCIAAADLGGVVNIGHPGANGIHFNANAATSYCWFMVNGGAVGSIQTNGTVTAYNTTSDRRIKDNIQAAADTGALVDGLRVVAFDWAKGDQSHVSYGLIAQEVHEVLPEIVSVGLDDLTEDGVLVQPWGLDYARLIPVLLKEVQSLRSRVAQLGG